MPMFDTRDPRLSCNDPAFIERVQAEMRGTIQPAVPAFPEPTPGPWVIDPVDPPEGGRRYWLVGITTGSDHIRLAVEYESEARTLRDTLNRIRPSASAWAI